MTAVAPRIEPQIAEPLLFAHRGASAVEADNTLAAFRTAVRLGTNSLESDVWASADGVAVLAHDDKVGPIGRRRRITKSARTELPDHIPSLIDLFEDVGPDINLSLDLKHDDAFEPTVVALRSLSGSLGENVVQRTWLCHPDIDALAAWRQNHSDVRLVHSTRLGAINGGPERHAAQLFEAGIDAVNFRAPDWSGGLTTLYHKFGIYCFGWDAQLTRVARELLDMGCDGIYSNYVERMLEARQDVWGF